MLLLLLSCLAYDYLIRFALTQTWMVNQVLPSRQKDHAQKHDGQACRNLVISELLQSELVGVCHSPPSCR